MVAVLPLVTLSVPQRGSNKELETTTQRQEIVSCFLRDYQLYPEEISALRDEELMKIFSKHSLMSKKFMPTAKCCLGHIIRWVQAECRKLGDTDNPDISELLKTAVCCLRERPVLFKYCAEEALASERELWHIGGFAKSSENGSGKTESDLTFVLDRIF